MTSDNLKGWRITATPIPARPGGGQFGKGALHFNVIIDAPGAMPWVGHYSVGSAVPVTWAQSIAREGGKAWVDVRRELGMTQSAKNVLALPWDARNDSVHQRNMRERIAKVYTPPLEDVVSSLCLDAYSGSFREWCDDFDGVDSGMKASDAPECYQACCKAEEFLRAAAGPNYDELQEEMSEL